MSRVTRYFKAEKHLFCEKFILVRKFGEKNMAELFCWAGGFARLRGWFLFSSLFFAKSLIFGLLCGLNFAKCDVSGMRVWTCRRV
jgi:hypothetical protein